VTGAVIYSPNLGWRDVPLAARLCEALGVPVVVENDVRAAAWGEFVTGAGGREGSLVAVFVGTGVGSGAVLDGRLWRGAGNAAGEVGHTQVVPDGLPCRCGRHGCLEQYVSGSGFQRRLAAAMAEGRTSRLVDVSGGEPTRLAARDVYAAAKDGDGLATEFWSDATRFLTMAVANYVTLFNPRVLVMGGGVIATVPALFDAVVSGVPSLTTILAGRSLRIERATLGDLSGVIGAAALATPA
jgi:glucokinase